VNLADVCLRSQFCLNGGLLLGTIDGASIEIAEEVGEDNVFFFGTSFTIISMSHGILIESDNLGHLHAAVEDLRYQHAYHPVPLEQRSPALAEVLDQISAGTFGDGSIFEPCVFSKVRPIV
jgi:glycogen phosphorylase